MGFFFFCRTRTSVGLAYKYICWIRLQLYMWDQVTILCVGFGYNYICGIRLQLYLQDLVTNIFVGLDYNYICRIRLQLYVCHIRLQLQSRAPFCDIFVDNFTISASFITFPGEVQRLLRSKNSWVKRFKGVFIIKCFCVIARRRRNPFCFVCRLCRLFVCLCYNAVVILVWCVDRRTDP